MGLPGGWPAPNTYGTWSQPAIPIPSPADPILVPAGTVNLLLLGSDRHTGSGFRTDTIVLASIQPSQGLVTLVSIPRDLYVYLPGLSVSRINTAWIYGASLGYPGGGPQLMADTIRYNLGVAIDRYVLVEMEGFRRIIDTLGGIEVRVACPYTDWRLRQPDLPQERASSWALFTTPQGIVSMDGDYALWYARARQRSSDFDRSRRQQEVLRAAYRQALRPDLLARIPEMYLSMKNSVVTNLTLEDALQLGSFAARLGPAQVRSRFIGRDQVSQYRVPTSGASVLLPRAEAIHHLLESSIATIDPQPDGDRVQIGILPTGIPELSDLARERLLYAGWEAILLPGDTVQVPSTELRVSAEADPETVAKVLTALGLPGATVRTEPGAAPDEILLAVGSEYNPCFNPTVSLGAP